MQNHLQVRSMILLFHYLPLQQNSTLVKSLRMQLHLLLSTRLLVEMHSTCFKSSPYSYLETGLVMKRSVVTIVIVPLLLSIAVWQKGFFTCSPLPWVFETFLLQLLSCSFTLFHIISRLVLLSICTFFYMYVFLDPPPLPRVSIGLVQCVSSYTFLHNLYILSLIQNKPHICR